MSFILSSYLCRRLSRLSVISEYALTGIRGDQHPLYPLVEFLMSGSRALLSCCVGVLALFGLVVGGAVQADFDEGIDYGVLKFPEPEGAMPPPVVKVQEFFWYGCPHCYSIEEPVKQLIKGLPEGVVFERIPAALNPRWEIHARAYFAAQSLGVAARTHTPLFNAIHRDGQRLTNRDSLAAFYADHGVDPVVFKRRLASFGVDAEVRRAVQMARRYRVRSVPTFIVAGKYTTGPGVTGSNRRTMDVVRYLVDKALADRR